MDHLLLDLEIDAACWEFLAARIVARRGTKPAQPIVVYLDAMPPDEREQDPDWDELTARAAAMAHTPGLETSRELTERVLQRMGI
jgi:hypothetical protein